MLTAFLKLKSTVLPGPVIHFSSTSIQMQ